MILDLLKEPAIIAAVLAALLGAGVMGAFLTHYFTNVLSDRALKRENTVKQLEKVYEPIIQVLDTTYST